MQIAIEMKNYTMMDFLFELDKEGPDVMQVRK